MQSSTLLSGASDGARDLRTVARTMLQILACRGVRLASGIPGGLVSPIFDALADVPEIELVVTRHESIAAFAAMGYAAATGRPALVLTTAGPGITNAMTGIAAAFAEELPLIVIGGDIPSSGRGRSSIQDSSTNALDAVAMLRTVTRWSASVENGAAVASFAEQAYHLATGARPGPVFLSLPLDTGLTHARSLGRWTSRARATGEWPRTRQSSGSSAGSLSGAS